MSPLMGPVGAAVPIAVSPAAFAAESGALFRRGIAAVGAPEEPGLSRKSRDALLDEAIAAFREMPIGRPALAGRPRYRGERGGIRPPERLPDEADWRDLGTRVEAHGRLNRRTTARLDASRHERRYEWLDGPMKDLFWIATPTMRIGTAAD